MPAKALSVRAQNSSPDDTSPISKLRKAKECALKKMTSDSWLELVFIWGVSDAIPKLKSSTWTTAKPSSYKITTSGIFIFLFVLNKNKVWNMPGKHVVGIFADFRREGKSSHSNHRISIKNVLLIQSIFMVTYNCTLSCQSILIWHYIKTLTYVLIDFQYFCPIYTVTWTTRLFGST